MDHLTNLTHHWADIVFVVFMWLFVIPMMLWMWVESFDEAWLKPRRDKRKLRNIFE